MRRLEVDRKQAGHVLLRQDLVDGREGVGGQSAIGVQEQQVVVARGARPGVHLWAATARRLQYAGTGATGDANRAIRTAAVDDDDFRDLVEYIQVGERFRKGTLLVECGDDDREWTSLATIASATWRCFAS